MFKNRTIQIGLGQKAMDDTDKINVDEKTYEGKAAIIALSLDKMAKKIAIGVAAYVVLDTVRQVMIVSASKDIKP